MRQRKIKGLTKEKLTNMGVITSSEKLNLNGDIYLEIGAGKGSFITSIALDNSNNYYVAFEKNINVCLRIIEKVLENNLNNVIVVLDDASNILDYFNDNTISLIYLNFSDPWPKEKHHKRRLTHPNFLKSYQKLLKKDGIIQFRTDHLALFNDSIKYFNGYFDIIELNNNYQSDRYITEYELKRIEQGNLYQLRGVKK